MPGHNTFTLTTNSKEDLGPNDCSRCVELQILLFHTSYMASILVQSSVAASAMTALCTDVVQIAAWCMLLQMP